MIGGQVPELASASCSDTSGLETVQVSIFRPMTEQQVHDERIDDELEAKHWSTVDAAGQRSARSRTYSEADEEAPCGPYSAAGDRIELGCLYASPG
jgi:hypothetical protein